MDAIKSIDQYAPIVPENHSDIEDLNESRQKTNEEVPPSLEAIRHQREPRMR